MMDGYSAQVSIKRRGGMNRKTVSLLIALFLTVAALMACSGPAAVAPTPAPAEFASPIPSSPAAATPSPLPTQPPPTATAEPAVPTEPPAPTATATPGESFLKVPAVGCCRGRTLEPGRYAFPPWFGIPLTVDAPEGWRVLNESAALLFMLGRGENAQNNPSQIILFLNATGSSSLESLIETIRNAPQLAETAAPAEVAIAGFAGRQVDMTALPNPTFEGSAANDIPPGVQYLPAIERYLTPGFAWTTSTPEARVRAIALTVGDQTLLIYIEAPPQEFDELAADAGAILESLELTTPESG
jgi:hypothetical protein